MIPCTPQRFNDFKEAQEIAFEDGDIYNEVLMYKNYVVQYGSIFMPAWKIQLDIE